MGGFQVALTAEREEYFQVICQMAMATASRKWWLAARTAAGHPREYAWNREH
jgi:hypothetical protein